MSTKADIISQVELWLLFATDMLVIHGITMATKCIGKKQLYQRDKVCVGD